MREVRAKLMEELKSLEHELRVELPKEIHTAQAMGDLKENAEYHAALERQGFLRARVSQLRKRLTDLGTANLGQIPRDRVGIGSNVSLLDLDSDEEVGFELVFPEMAKSEKGMISVASPIGKGLLGRKEGDQVTIHIPSGRKRFEILKFTTLYDKKKDEADT